MIDTIDRKDVLALAETRKYSVSMLLPTATKGRERMEAHIRLRNQIVEAEGMLVSLGMRRTVAKCLLKPAEMLVADERFWMTQAEGLAVYLAPNFARVVKLPVHVATLTTVCDHFFIRPLLDMLSQKPFFVLAIDQKSARLIKAHHEAAEEVHVPGMPAGIDDIVGVEHYEKARQMHLAGRRGQAGSVISHGAGDRGADPKNEILRYCQAVDKAVCRYLAKSNATLVLAADSPAEEIYLKASHYPHLHKRALKGSPKMATPAQLREGAAAMLEPIQDIGPQKFLGRFQELADSGLAADSIEAIVKAGAGGKIDSLMVSNAKLAWGKVDGAGKVRARTKCAAGVEELLNRAAIDAIKSGGEIFEVSPADLPRNSSAVAILRA